ncbi:MAG: hypothetical protein CNCCGFBP_01489 [Fimbriimonadaceae bacterium]|nr:hypothetical protein [Fimbriimonadaceae bacterium]
MEPVPSFALGLPCEPDRPVLRSAGRSKAMVLPRRGLLADPARSNGSKPTQLARHSRALRSRHHALSQPLRLLCFQCEVPPRRPVARSQGEELDPTAQGHRHGARPRHSGESNVIRSSVRHASQPQSPVRRHGREPLRVHTRGGSRNHPQTAPVGCARVPDRGKRPRSRVLPVLSGRLEGNGLPSAAPHEILGDTQSAGATARQERPRFHGPNQVQRRAVGRALHHGRRPNR